jgi:ragB/susD domain protein
MFSLLLMTSCSDFLDLTPISEASSANYYKNTTDINSALSACYGSLQGTYQYGEYFIALMELRSDNVEDINPGGSAGMFYFIDNFTATSGNNVIRYAWKELYNQIYRCNNVLASSHVIADETLRKQYEGEALFLRALAYFNIVRLWGDAPLILKPVTPVEAVTYGRTPVADIYKVIEDDLKEAAANLESSYSGDDLGRVTSVAAEALLGKVYLTEQKWSDAATLLDNIIQAYSSQYGLLDDIADVFKVSNEMNKEILFAVRYSKSVIGEGHGYNDYFKDKSLIYSDLKAAYGPTDERLAMIEYKKVDDNNNVIAKYYDTFDATTKKVGFDLPLLRWSDVLLMCAEAHNEVAYDGAESGKAMSALILVRERAKAGKYTAATLADQSSFRKAVLEERRLEFPFELQRWFDLVRTDTAIDAMAKAGYTITKNDYLYPLPKTEVDLIDNPATFPQNPGYN